VNSLRAGITLAGSPLAAEVATPPRVEQEVRVADPGDDLTGWFCVATDPFPCPAPGCPFVARYMTASHLILVWPRDTDPDLLAQAVRAREAGRNPKVREYERSMGNCIAWDAWVARGGPVHAFGDRPPGYPERYERL
jgi:hypothetical protein